MGLFNFFKKNKNSEMELPMQNETVEGIGSNESVNETEAKAANDNRVFINYGTGMPIDLIYSFLKEDYETKGYEDALTNPDVSYKEMNKAMIRSRLEVKFQQVLLRYENDLQDIEFHINSRAEAGLVDVVRMMKMKKDTLLEHVSRIKKMEQDFQDNALYMTGMLLSYERGFLKGLAAVSLDHLQLNMNNNKEGGIL